jgi:outer membrane biosynthesis protein TonB
MSTIGATIGANDVNTLTTFVAGEMWNSAIDQKIAIDECVRQMLAILAPLSREDQLAAEAGLKAAVTQQIKRNRETKQAEKARQSQEAESSTPSTPSTPVKSKKSKDKKSEKTKKSKDKKRERSPSTPKNKHIVTEEPVAPKKSRGPNHCGKCKGEGHTARSKKCPQYEAKPKQAKEQEQEPMEVDSSDSSSSSDNSSESSDEE